MACEFKAVRRGWYLGDKAFRKELLAQMKEQQGAKHYGEETDASDEEKAQEIVQQELKRRGWTERDLQTRRKGDKNKIVIVEKLRQETTMTYQWIAQRLVMGSFGHVSNLLAARRAKK